MRRFGPLLLASCATPSAAPVAPPTPAMSAQASAAAPATHSLKEGLVTTEEIRARMKLVAAALGVKCAHCHDVADFAADTPTKRIANMMWERMVVSLRTRDGKKIFCDHCHQGRTHFLDRTNEDALKAWMKSNYVEKLIPHDGSSMECDTCHRGARWKFLPHEH